MAFGGYCPLPLRLGIGSEEECVSATQWQRLANDVAALGGPRVLAVITYDCAATPTVVQYVSCAGAGVSMAPTIAYVSTGVVDITWPSSFTDDHDVTRDFTILCARAQGHEHGGVTLTDNAGITVGIGGVTSAIRVTAHNQSNIATNGRVSLVVFGLFGPPAAHTDYGGNVDKQNCESERIPYAYTWYNEYTAMLGSAFSQEHSGYIHAIKLAAARLHAAEMRTAERFSCNAMPSISNEASPSWCRVFAIPTGSTGDPTLHRTLIGTRLAAAEGPSVGAVDGATSRLLGTNLVALHRYTTNALNDPPEITRWPGGTVGPDSMDLGGGAWFSQRSHLFVEVTEPSGDASNYRELLDTHLFSLLDRILPAHATFDWGSTDSDGFIIGESIIGVDAL